MVTETEPVQVNGYFSGETRLRLPADDDNTIEIDAGDVDGDGDLDFVTANVYAEQNRIYINNGKGYFTDETLNSDGSPNRLPVDSDISADVELADVDGDGDLDLFFANSELEEGAQNKLYLNDGNGYFTEVTAEQLPVLKDFSRDAIFLDVDKDGDLDILVANSIFLGSQVGGQFNRILINNGAGYFTDETFDAEGDPLRLPEDIGSTRDIAGADVDDDGDIDLLVANRAISNQNRLFLNDSTGYFTDATATQLPIDVQSSRDADFGDVDNDGDLDAYICNASKEGAQNRLWINDGNGFFSDQSLNPDGSALRLPAQTEISKDADFGDVDGDGDLDIALANCRYENGVVPTETGQQNRIYINSGTGYFVDETLYPDGSARRFIPLEDNSYDIEFFDAENDGDLDILVANRTQQNRLLINTSTIKNQITLLYPPRGAKAASPPNFKWVAGDHDYFLIQFATDPNFNNVLWSDLKRSNGQQIMVYSLLPYLFDNAPAGVPIYWRVAGVDKDRSPLKVIFSYSHGLITKVQP
ncbi:MAG: hypothetical protein Kow0099_08160 [Candidatus Abyssubacteria bacterium]